MKFLNGNGQQEADVFLYHLCNLLAAVEESKHEQSVSDKLNKKLFNDNAIEFKTNLLTFVKAGTISDSTLCTQLHLRTRLIIL